MAFNLPKLPYSYDALEPYIDARTMEIHHTKHHQTYTDKLNTALKEQPAEVAGKPVEELLQNLAAIPDDIRTAVRNHGGGYANHNLFWTVMAPASKTTKKPTKKLSTVLDKSFESFEKFCEQFSQVATGVFGSSWAWLVVGSNSELKIMSTPNQDTPLSQGMTPILGLDVWEHAYYLKYQNKRPEYIAAWWNVVNWEKVAENYSLALRQAQGSSTGLL